MSLRPLPQQMWVPAGKRSGAGTTYSAKSTPSRISEQLMVGVPELRQLKKGDTIRDHRGGQQSDPAPEILGAVALRKPDVNREQCDRNGEHRIAEEEEAFEGERI